METENIQLEDYFKYSEGGILKRNAKLHSDISNFIKGDVPFKGKFYCFYNKIEMPTCKICSGPVKFKNMTIGFNDYCSNDCRYSDGDLKERKRKTNLERYGVDNPSKSSIIKEKVKESNNKKFGYDYPLQSSEVKERFRNTNLEKYGVDNPSKLKEFRERAENTNLEKFGVKHAMQNTKIADDLKLYFINEYGVDNPSKLKEVRERAENTNLEKFGVKHAMQNKIIKEISKTSILKKYGDYYSNTQEYKNIMNRILLDRNNKEVNNEELSLISFNKSEYTILCKGCNKVFNIQRQLYRNRKNLNKKVCLICNPITNGSSSLEFELSNFIKSIYSGDIINNYRYENKEIDIFLPDLNVGFEFNGLYWHSELHKDKKYHYDKIKFFERESISIMMIWEDDWEYKKDIIHSMIRSKIYIVTRKIFARKCEVRSISDNKMVSNFLNNNHLQGNINSSIKIGLFYNNELVSLMTFGKLRKSLGSKTAQNEFELLRFCNIKDTIVVGGASRLLEFFKRNFEYSRIVSYSKNCIGNGNLYKTIGFKLISETEIDYSWVINKIRYHRFSFRKDALISQGYDINKTEVEIMYDRGYFRVFGAGNKKWLLDK